MLSSKNSAPLALACSMYVLKWKAYLMKLDCSMFENYFSM